MLPFAGISVSLTHLVLKRYSFRLLNCFNPFPHMDAFWRLCSRWLFENIATKEEIAQNVQFLLLPQCFPPLVIGYPFNYRDFFIFWQKTFKVVCCRIVIWGKGFRVVFYTFDVFTYMWARVNPLSSTKDLLKRPKKPFPLTTNLQQTTLKTFRQK